MAHMPPGMMHAQPVMVPMYPVTYPSGQVGYIPVPGMFPGTMSPAQPGQGQATPTPQAHAQISEGEAASLKRGASESSGEEERSPIGPPPKAKKPRAKKQGNEESGGVLTLPVQLHAY